MLRYAAALLLALVLLLSFPLSTEAQRKGDEPKRPALPSSADTNDARAYYEFGLAVLNRDPKVAANAFYWSSRLDPNSADAFYARRVALLLSDPRRLEDYWRGSTSTMRRADIQAIDSLYLHALTLNPFFYEKLERELQNAVIRGIVSRATASGGGAGETEYEIQRYLASAGWGEKAFRAYSNGAFKDALQYYASAIKESPRYKYYYRNLRGRLFFQIGNPDSALTELSLAVEDMRKRDKKDLVYVYQSKALLEHSIGLAHESLGDKAAARDAYARALQEDLAYSPAHVRLGYQAIDNKDTATALSEFDLAVQLRPEDSGLRYQYGYLLAKANKAVEAEGELMKALELNPSYTAPHLALGTLYELQGKVAEASQSYRAFLAQSSKSDVRRAEVDRRLQSLASR